MTRPTVQFLGGVSTVTGSRFLFEHDGRRLLVDCGMFQGYKQLRQRNWTALQVDPRSIDAVVLTHAHIDHSGWLPVLVRDGFTGPIYASGATVDLTRVLLADAGRLQEADAEHAARHGFSKHDPPAPLYTEADAKRACASLKVVASDAAFAPLPGWSARLTRAGHILGASTVALEVGGATVVVSGDLGREDDPLMFGPAPRPASDYLLVESTYGNRTHPAGDPSDALAEVVRRTIARRGTVIIPTFAVGRAQLLMLLLHRLREAGTIPDVPTVLDSPLADAVTNLYIEHLGEHRLDAELCRRAFGSVRVAITADDSRALTGDAEPKIILAGSGMATGGRVVHHLKRFAAGEQHTVLFAGFQAGGTRGAAMTQGAESIKIHGDWIPVRAEILVLPGLSAHADADGLMRWIRSESTVPRRTFVVHGEPDAADRLRLRLSDELHADAWVPEHLERVTLE